MKIHYEKHPVTPERKAELRSSGVKIIDARFAPNQAPENANITTRSDIATMKRKDCIEWLRAHGDDSPSGTVLELRDRLKSVMFFDG